MILTDLQIAARSLAQHTKRTLFLGLALAAVTGLLIVLNGLTEGIRTTMLHSATTLMTGHVNVGGFFKVTSGQAAPLVTDVEKVLADTRPHVPELDYLVLRGRGYAKAVSGQASMDLVLGGIDLGDEQGFREVIKVKAGSLDALKEPGTILLFEESAKKLRVTAGDALTLVAPTTRGQSNTTDVRVGAVAWNMGMLSSFNAYLPSQTLRDLYQMRSDTTGAIQLYLKDPAQSTVVAERLRERLKQAGHRVMDPEAQPYYMKLFMRVNSEDWTGQKLDVTTWQDETSMMSWVLAALQGLSFFLVLILLGIIAAGIVSSMWIAIRERTREIGTLRAIGMHRRGVLRMILLEAGLLGLLGTGVGAVCGIGFSALINAVKIPVPDAARMILMSDTLQLTVTGGSVVFAIILITLVTTLAAAYPAMHAARLKPVTAMHHIG